MKRKIVALALAAAMVMGLAGCGAKEEPAAPADTKTEAPAEEKEEAPAEVATWAPDGPVTVICPYGAGGGLFSPSGFSPLDPLFRQSPLMPSWTGYLL